MSKAGYGPLTEPLFAALAAHGQVDSAGSFTLDGDIARERIRNARFANPVRYVLELVQAAVQKGAANISFRFAPDGMHMYFDGDPFGQNDFAELYTSLLLKPSGKSAQARRLLALGLCSALQLEPALIRVESGDAFVELRPGQPDRTGSLDPLTALTHIHLRHRLKLGLIKRFVDHLGGHLTEEVLLQERCVHARMLIEVEGKRISEGYVLPEVTVWRTFTDHGIGGVVGVAPAAELSGRGRQLQSTPESALSPTFLRLVKNGVWVDTQMPIELLPGFRALAESSTFRLDIAREHVVQDQKYAAVLRAIAAAQLDLLATLCRLHADGQLVRDGQVMIDPQHLRALLRGLLWRLGGLGPLLRWAEIPVSHFPPGIIVEGSAFWPTQLADGASLLGVPIFQSTTGEPVPLSRLIKDFADHKNIAYSAFRSREPDAKRSLVLFVAEPANQDLLRTLFGGALECRDGAMAAASERERNRVAWLRRVYQPTLKSQGLISRVPLHAQGLTGEAGLDPRPLSRLPWERSLHRAPTLRLLLIKDGCLLVEKNGSFAVPGLSVAVSGDFTPSYLYDDVASDARLGAVVDALFDALPALIEQTANTPLPPGPSSVELSSTPPLDPQLRGRAAALRAMLMLTLSSKARGMARSALGVPSTRGPDQESQDDYWLGETPMAGVPIFTPGRSLEDSSEGEIPAHLFWVQLRDWPLFETIDGLPLRPRDLEEAAFRYGYLAVLCPSPTMSPKRLERWAALCRADGAPKEVWQQVYALSTGNGKGSSPSPDRPPFVLFLSPIEKPLFDIIGQQLPPTRLVDAEPWLSAISAISAVYAQERSETLSLPERCALQVPLPGIDGYLGVLQDAGLFRAFAHEPRVAAALLCKRHHLGTHEIYLPGGQFLSAVADERRLRLDDDLMHIAETEELPLVRQALCAALLPLVDKLTQQPVPWPPLQRLLLFDIATALFPRPLFRQAYDALHQHARAAENGIGADDVEPVDAEQDYASILRLGVATSLERVEAVLERHLATGNLLSPDKIIRDVLSVGPIDDPEAPLPPELLRAATPPDGALFWIDMLYPPGDVGPIDSKSNGSRKWENRVVPTFAERALHLLPAVATAPLLTTPDGAPLSLAELIEDFRTHGQVLYATATPASIEPRRPVVFDPSSALVPVLHCLFGPDNVRESGGAFERAMKPSASSWPSIEVSSALAALPAHPSDSNEDRLLSAVVAELRELGTVSERLLRGVNLAWLQIDDSDEPLAVVCDAQHFIINRRHPAVKRALDRFHKDPQCVRFIASAAYTALSARLEAADFEAADQKDAANFYQHLSTRALSEAR